MIEKNGRGITETGRTSFTGAPIYHIAGSEGEWLRRMVDIEPHKKEQYFTDISKQYGKSNVVRTENDFFIRRDRK